MRAFYKMAVTKLPVGSAIRHKEPPLAGEVVIKVSDMSTRGDFKLVVLDCTAEQHADNLLFPGVAELSESDAVALAAKYRPAHTRTELNERTGKEEKVEVPVVDLRAFLAPAETAPKPKRRTAKSSQ